jgi:hypothetical protein
MSHNCTLPPSALAHPLFTCPLAPYRPVCVQSRSVNPVRCMSVPDAQPLVPTAVNETTAGELIARCLDHDL